MGDVSLSKVVFEFKSNITTHDVITYSNKARRNKQIYPCLRYGLISYNLSTIPKRFFIHNEGLDFYLTIKEHSNNLETVLKVWLKKKSKFQMFSDLLCLAMKNMTFLERI